MNHAPAGVASRDNFGGKFRVLRYSKKHLLIQLTSEKSVIFRCRPISSFLDFSVRRMPPLAGSH